MKKINSIEKFLNAEIEDFSTQKPLKWLSARHGLTKNLGTYEINTVEDFAEKSSPYLQN